MKSFLYALLFFFSISALAAPPTSKQVTFLERENINSSTLDFTKSTVSKKYLPGKGVEFELPYLLIPIDDLTFVDSGTQSSQLSSLLVTNAGVTYLKFFIHPESFDLYRPLIVHYGFSGHYRASPTASTRTLLAWDEAQPSASAVFAKVSLDKTQSNLGRPVSDWEVRRSVLITMMLQGAEAQDLLEHGVYVIPEFAGAYVDVKWGMGSHIDNVQHKVFRHGLIFRDLSFIEKFNHLDIFPLFSIFSEREGAKEPLIVEWWKESGEADFSKFLHDFLVDPFVKSTARLVFKHGLIPDTHAQNVLVGFNPKTKKLETFFHRDVGSMKVSFKMRLAQGLPIKELQTHSALYDFKFKWAEDIFDKPFMHWFYESVLGSMDQHDSVLRNYVNAYSSAQEYQHLGQEVLKEMAAMLPIKRQTARFDPHGIKKSINDHAEEFIETHPPDNLAELVYQNKDVKAGEGQTLWLPREWPTDKIELQLPAAPVWQKEATPLHYEKLVEADEIFTLSSNSLTPENPSLLVQSWSRRKFQYNGDVDLFPVLKVGTPERPRYFMISGYDRALALKGKGKKIRVEVLEDVSGLAPAKQLEIAEKFDASWVERQVSSPVESCEAKALLAYTPFAKELRKRFLSFIAR